MLTAGALGFLLGLRHASDPDHVVAISAILARHRRATTAAAIGAAWGLGHGVMLLAVGGAIVALRIAVPEQVALAFELVVGVVLVALGIESLRARRSELAHVHPHAGAGASAREHGGATTGLGAARAVHERRAALAAPLHSALARAACVGLVHGLAGSAGVALLALAAMPSASLALAYLAVFALGTVGGMVAISLGVGTPLALFGDRRPVQRWIVAGSGVLSIGFGAWIVWEIGFVRGLIG